MLGRVFAVVESSYWLTTGIGAILAPLLVSLLGIRGALIAIGACLPLVVAARWIALARFEAATDVPEKAFALLRALPLFQPLPLCQVENVSRRLRKIEVVPGEAVIREGEAGERFFVIADGEFEVSCTRGSYPPLAGGDWFGEIALLRDLPRTATVTARTDGLLYALDRERPSRWSWAGTASAAGPRSRWPTSAWRGCRSPERPARLPERPEAERLAAAHQDSETQGDE